MPITERTLRKWRGEALGNKITISSIDHNKVKYDIWEPTVLESTERILRMTQELLDNHLMRKI